VLFGAASPLPYAAHLISTLRENLASFHLLAKYHAACVRLHSQSVLHLHFLFIDHASASLHTTCHRLASSAAARTLAPLPRSSFRALATRALAPMAPAKPVAEIHVVSDTVWCVSSAAWRCLQQLPLRVPHPHDPRLPAFISSPPHATHTPAQPHAPPTPPNAARMQPLVLRRESAAHQGDAEVRGPPRIPRALVRRWSVVGWCSSARRWGACVSVLLVCRV